MLVTRGILILRALLAAIVVLAALPAPAAPKVSIDMGFGGLYRSGRWTPVYITVSDPSSTATRNVLAEVVSPHDQSHAMGIATRFALRPQPTTFVVYVPLTQQLDETVLNLYDLDNRKHLGKVAFADPMPGGFNANVSYGEILLGVSGRGPALGEIDGPFKWDKNAAPSDKTTTPPALEEEFFVENATRANSPLLRVGRVAPLWLPDVAAGYDGLDALVLNAPDLVKLPLGKQKAIADWVRGGGRLLLWPGDPIVPGSSPIVDILPCTIGDHHEIVLSVEETGKQKLLSSLEKLPARRLQARPGGRMYSVLGGKGQVCIGRVGVGNVAVLSFDGDRLRFVNDTNYPVEQVARRFWRPILRELLEPTIHDKEQRSYWYGTAEDVRHDRALHSVVDVLGNVPGVGAFDMKYILIVLLAMMFIVGPIDWWVLRKLNRQPWTWATIAGWIILITTGAIFIGTLFKSGDLHYRTVRLIDQADGQVVGVHDVIGIYSPRTQEYGLQSPPDLWWRPANMNRLHPMQRRRPTAGKVAFDQGREGTLLHHGYDSNGNPRPAMTVNVWNLRFLESAFADTSGIKPLISADLKRATGEGSRNTITGSITNLSPQPLRNVRILVREGFVRPAQATIEPGQTVQVSGQWQARPQRKEQEEYYYYGYNGQGAYDAQDPEASFSRATCDLAGDRTTRINKLLETRDDVAVVIADSEGVPVTIGLVHENGEPPFEKHWRVIRAVVPLK